MQSDALILEVIEIIQKYARDNQLDWLAPHILKVQEAASRELAGHPVDKFRDSAQAKERQDLPTKRDSSHLAEIIELQSCQPRTANGR